MLSTLQGVEAVKAVLEATPQTPTPVITIRENKIERSPLMDAVAETKKVAEAIKNKRFDIAMGLRDAEFKEYFKSYRLTTSTDNPKWHLPKEKVCLIALIFDYRLTLCSACALP